MNTCWSAYIKDQLLVSLVLIIPWLPSLFRRRSLSGDASHSLSHLHDTALDVVALASHRTTSTPPPCKASESCVCVGPTLPTAFDLPERRVLSTPRDKGLSNVSLTAIPPIGASSHHSLDIVPDFSPPETYPCLRVDAFSATPLSLRSHFQFISFGRRLSSLSPYTIPCVVFIVSLHSHSLRADLN